MNFRHFMGHYGSHSSHRPEAGSGVILFTTLVNRRIVAYQQSAVRDRLTLSVGETLAAGVQLWKPLSPTPSTRQERFSLCLFGLPQRFILRAMGHTASMRMPVYAGAIGERFRFILLAVLLAYVPLICVALLPARLSAEQLAVRHTEGLVHGFLALRTLEGNTLADGELIQVAHGDSVTSRLVFHFKDGSLHEETAVCSQRRSFRLVSDHLVQKGPAFPHPLDVTIDTTSGQVKVLYTDDGKQKVETQRLALPPNLANGITFTLIKNIARDATRTTLSMVAATPKPRLVKLAITSQGEDEFSIAGATLKATHYVVKIEIGGAAGMLAPLLGKQPPDTHVWVLGGEAPAFVKSEGPLFLGGPIWRIELTSPVWPKVPAADTKEKDENKH